MRVYTTQHSHYCGVDLHARTLFLNVLDDNGRTRGGKLAGCQGANGVTTGELGHRENALRVARR